MKVSLFAQALPIDHKFLDDGMKRDGQNQADLLVSRHVLYVIAKHFCKIVSKQYNDGLEYHIFPRTDERCLLIF